MAINSGPGGGKAQANYNARWPGEARSRIEIKQAWWCLAAAINQCPANAQTNPELWRLRSRNWSWPATIIELLLKGQPACGTMKAARLARRPVARRPGPMARRRSPLAENAGNDPGWPGEAWKSKSKARADKTERLTRPEASERSRCQGPGKRNPARANAITHHLPSPDPGERKKGARRTRPRCPE